MFSSLTTSKRYLRRLILLGVLLFSLSGCQYLQQLPFDLPFLSQRKSPDKAGTQAVKKEKRLSKIYIQNFSGQKIKEVQQIFFEAAKEQSYFTFMELLPDDLDGLGVLRIDVTDYQIWELDETVGDNERFPGGKLKPGDPIKRRNAIVSLNVSLFEAETGRRLVSRRFSQPFQQIYIGADAIQNRPDSSVELERLTKMLIFNLLDSFLTGSEKIVPIQYEIGTTDHWLAKKINSFGNRRIQKGIRYAEAGDLNEAIWIWKIYLFSPDEAESQPVFFQNRAAAYYNLGVAFQLKKDWWQAAEMFSSANRIQQRLKYAQAWGNSMQTWLEEQRSPKPKMAALPVEKVDLEPIESKEEKRPQEVIDLEENQQLLLKPRILWPLDPHLKQQETTDTSAVKPKPGTI